MAQPDKVANIAALRALASSGLSDGDLYYVQGYSSRLDGGEGWFEYIGASTRDDDNGTWLEPDDSPSTGRWRRQHDDGEINVRWFGAVGDGSTNDYQAFRDAIDSLAPTGTPSHGTTAAYGGRIYVPRSEAYYAVDPVAGGSSSGYLEINRSVEICGANFGSSFTGTALRFTDGGISVTPADNVLANPRGDFCTLRNLWIRGNNQLYHGVLVRARCQIYDCKVSHFGWDGVFIDGVDGSPVRNANNTRLWGVSVENNGAYGLHARGSDANAVWFYGIFGANNGIAAFRLSPFLGGAMFGSSSEATVGHNQIFPDGDGEYLYTYAVPSQGIAIGDKIDPSAQYDEAGDPIPDETDDEEKLGYYVDGDANRFLLAATYCEADSRKIVLGPNAVLISHVGSGGYDQIFPTDGDNLGMVMVDASNISPFVVRSGVPGEGRRTAVAIGSKNGRKILSWQVTGDPSGTTDSQSWSLAVRPEENRTILAVEGAPGFGDANVILAIPDVDGDPLGSLEMPQGFSEGGSRVTVVADKPDDSEGADGDVAIKSSIGSEIGWRKISGTWTPIVRVVQIPSSETAAITRIQSGG